MAINPIAASSAITVVLLAIMIHVIMLAVKNMAGALIIDSAVVVVATWLAVVPGRKCMQMVAKNNPAAKPMTLAIRR